MDRIESAAAIDAVEIGDGVEWEKETAERQAPLTAARRQFRNAGGRRRLFSCAAL